MFIIFFFFPCQFAASLVIIAVRSIWPASIYAASTRNNCPKRCSKSNAARWRRRAVPVRRGVLLMVSALAEASHRQCRHRLAALHNHRPHRNFPTNSKHFFERTRIVSISRVSSSRTSLYLFFKLLYMAFQTTL